MSPLRRSVAPTLRLSGRFSEGGREKGTFQSVHRKSREVRSVLSDSCTRPGGAALISFSFLHTRIYGFSSIRDLIPLPRPIRGVSPPGFKFRSTL